MKPSPKPTPLPTPAPIPPTRWIPVLPWNLAARVVTADPVLRFEPGTFRRP